VYYNTLLHLMSSITSTATPRFSKNLHTYERELEFLNIIKKKHPIDEVYK